MTKRMRLMPLVLLTGLIGAAVLGCSPREDSLDLSAEFDVEHAHDFDALAEDLAILDPIDGCDEAANKAHNLALLKDDFQGASDVLANSCEQTFRVVSDQAVYAMLQEDWNAFLTHAIALQDLAATDEEKGDARRIQAAAYFFSGHYEGNDEYIAKSDSLLEARLKEVPNDEGAIGLRLVINTYLENFELALELANQGIERTEDPEYFAELLEDIERYQNSGEKPAWLPE